jgi:hypothetical protein
MAYKAPKPTKAQLAEAKVRAAASGIAMNQSAKGLRNASKAIVAGASMLPAGRAVKTAATAVKAASKVSSAARANTRALKAANKNVGIKYKKGTNESNYSGRNETKPKQVAKSKVRSTDNINAPMTSPSSYKGAKSGYNTWAKNNPELAKANPPSGKFAPKISRSAKANKKFK